MLTRCKKQEVEESEGRNIYGLTSVVLFFMSPFSFTLVLLVSAGTGVFDVQMEKDVTFERGGRATPRRDRHKIGGKIVRTI